MRRTSLDWRRRTAASRCPRNGTDGRAPCRRPRRAADCRTLVRSARGTLIELAELREAHVRIEPVGDRGCRRARRRWRAAAASSMIGISSSRRVSKSCRTNSLRSSTGSNETSGNCSTTNERLPRRSMTTERQQALHRFTHRGPRQLRTVRTVNARTALVRPAPVCRDVIRSSRRSRICALSVLACDRLERESRPWSGCCGVSTVMGARSHRSGGQTIGDRPYRKIWPPMAYSSPAYRLLVRPSDLCYDLAMSLPEHTDLRRLPVERPRRRPQSSTRPCSAGRSSRVQPMCSTASCPARTSRSTTARRARRATCTWASTTSPTRARIRIPTGVEPRELSTRRHEHPGVDPRQRRRLDRPDPRRGRLARRPRVLWRDHFWAEFNGFNAAFNDPWGNTFVLWVKGGDDPQIPDGLDR